MHRIRVNQRKGRASYLDRLRTERLNEIARKRGFTRTLISRQCDHIATTNARGEDFRQSPRVVFTKKGKAIVHKSNVPWGFL